MKIAHILANAIAKPSPTQAMRDYRGAFGLLDGSVINVEGRNYVPQKLSVRSRLHNWLIQIGEHGDADP